MIENSTKQAKISLNEAPPQTFMRPSLREVKPDVFQPSPPQVSNNFATIFIFIVLILFLKSIVYMFNYDFCTRESLPIPKVINLITYTVSAYNKQNTTKEEKSLDESQNPEPNSQ